jgi:heat shock protein HslJ
MSDPAGLAPFDGIAWRATRFGSLLAHEPTAGQEFSLEVQGDRLAGRSGCNRFMGTWSVTDGALAIGPMASTMMWCDGLMELERSFLQALESARGARQDRDRLVLVNGDGGLVIQLVRAEASD